MSPAIEMVGLRKRYRRFGHQPRIALDGLDLVVETGQVHGLLGPAGCGKTTALRMLLGLGRANSGTIHVFGQRVPQALATVTGRIGAVCEDPRFFGGFSGRRTLDLLATTAGLPPARVDEALDLVGLAEQARDRVKTHSPGMTRRLAVASALMASPELLILDNPASGLDAGDIGELIRLLAAEGTTVVLSSRVATDLRQVCDSVTIMSAGRRVTHGPTADVLPAADQGDYRVRVFDHRRAGTILEEAGALVRVAGDHLLLSDVSDAAWVTETLAHHRLWVSEMTPITPDLDSVFGNRTDVIAEPELTEAAETAGVGLVGGVGEVGEVGGVERIHA